MKAARSDPAREAHAALEAALFEVKRVIVGQEGMLERLLVALLAGGHVLLEGVPGLAKTLTVKTVADVLGGSFKRLQFTPDLVPADLVGTRIYRADTGGFDTELGPVFCNFLLADEINRAPAKVQSALLEVMQERQVTIGHDTHRVPAPFLVLATQNPIESEGTYPLPEAQVDRFMFKLVVDYPAHARRGRRRRALADRRRRGARGALARRSSRATSAPPSRVYVDRRVMEYAVALTTATREPSEQGWVEFGASPRGSINLVHAGRALALLRGRDYVLPTDVRDLARDVLRHRIVLTYEALAAGVDADRVLDDVLEQVPVPRIELADEGARPQMSFREPLLLAGLLARPARACSRTGARSSAGAALRRPLSGGRRARRGGGTRARPPRPRPARAARAAGPRGRPRAARADGGRRAAPGHRDARARHVGLDERDRRAGPTGSPRPATRRPRSPARCPTTSGSGSSRSTPPPSSCPSRPPTAARCCARSTR